MLDPPRDGEDVAERSPWAGSVAVGSERAFGSQLARGEGANALHDM